MPSASANSANAAPGDGRGSELRLRVFGPASWLFSQVDRESQSLSSLGRATLLGVRTERKAPAVVVDGLSKKYGSQTAVDGVSFRVDTGEVFALLGPNGAGKTSTVEMLEGFRSRDAGTVSVLGIDPSDRSRQRDLRERLGVVLQDLAVEPFLTVEEVLNRSASYFPAPRDVGEVIRAVGLEEKAKSRVRSLSGGQQRRLDLGLGIVGNPELLFLDEPTTGFDPSARRGAWDVVRNLVRGGTTVILTTHYMDEAEICDRIAIIDGGTIVASGTPFELKKQYTKDRAYITTTAPQALEGLLDKHGLGYIKKEKYYRADADDIPGLLQVLSEQKDVITDLEIRKGTLNDVFLEITGREIREGDE